MNHGKYMLICVAVAAIGGIVLASAGLNVGYGLLFVLPCMLMMGLMMWMMVGGAGGRHSDKQ
jgi:hypothetical protein